MDHANHTLRRPCQEIALVSFIKSQTLDPKPLALQLSGLK